MNKKLLAAAVAAGLAAPMAANAGVTVYGLAQLEIADIETNGGNSTTNMIDSKNSRVGVKWTEDLGGGPFPSHINSLGRQPDPEKSGDAAGAVLHRWAGDVPDTAPYGRNSVPGEGLGAIQHDPLRRDEDLRPGRGGDRQPACHASGRFCGNGQPTADPCPMPSGDRL